MLINGIFFQHKSNFKKAFVAKFKMAVATYGEWQQGWTTLI
jgi:hypothetical protein